MKTIIPVACGVLFGAFAAASLTALLGPANASPDAELKGAIVAFKDRCPSGPWRPYDLAAGRTLVGSGAGQNYNLSPSDLDAGKIPDVKIQGSKLSPRASGAIGGQESVVLELRQTPNHTHTGSSNTEAWVFNRGGGGFGLSGGPGQMTQGHVGVTVGNIEGYPERQAPTPVMQPWLAVAYCVRI
jgi:hypothetical protein